MSNDTSTDGIDRSVFDAYDHECQKVADLIRPHLHVDGEGILNGRKWCKKHDIPESVFADAVNYHLEEADWGISPMHPWRYEDTDTARGTDS